MIPELISNLPLIAAGVALVVAGWAGGRWHEHRQYEGEGGVLDKTYDQGWDDAVAKMRVVRVDQVHPAESTAALAPLPPPPDETAVAGHTVYPALNPAELEREALAVGLPALELAGFRPDWRDTVSALRRDIRAGAERAWRHALMLEAWEADCLARMDQAQRLAVAS